MSQTAYNSHGDSEAHSAGYRDSHGRWRVKILPLWKLLLLLGIDIEWRYCSVCVESIGIADLKSILCRQEGHAFTYPLHCFQWSSESCGQKLVSFAHVWIPPIASCENLTASHKPTSATCNWSLHPFRGMATHVRFGFGVIKMILHSFQDDFSVRD